MAEDDSGMTQRERRREQYQKNKPKMSMSTQTQKRLLIGGFIVLVLGGVVTGMVLTAKSGDDCPGHWHSTFHIYLDGDRVSYQHPQYDLNQRTPFRSHLHQPNDNQVHFEQGCVDFDEFLGFVDTELRSDRIILDGGHEALGQAGTYTVEGNTTLTAYHKVGDGAWQTISISKLNGRQLLDQERVLVLYGEYTDEQVTELQNGVPRPSG